MVTSHLINRMWFMGYIPMEFPDTISGASEAQAFKGSHVVTWTLSWSLKGGQALMLHTLIHTNSTQDGDANEDDATFDNVRGSKRTAFWQPFRCSKPSSPIKCLHHISDGPGVRTQKYFEKPRTASTQVWPYISTCFITLLYSTTKNLQRYLTMVSWL